MVVLFVKPAKLAGRSAETQNLGEAVGDLKSVVAASGYGIAPSRRSKSSSSSLNSRVGC